MALYNLYYPPQKHKTTPMIVSEDSFKIIRSQQM